MSRKNSRRNGIEPGLSQRHRTPLSGREPALNVLLGVRYGDLRLKGLEAPAVGGRRRPLIFLAEANNGTAELLALVADSNGYDFKSSADGLETCELVRELQPELLIVNRHLSGMEGLALVRRVRADRDRLDVQTRLLVMDGYQQDDDILEAFYSGADDYLATPFELACLLRCWRRLIAHYRRPSPLTALLNGDAAVRRVALSFLLRERPEGLVRGLGELLSYPDSEVREIAEWSLGRLGTAEALSVLEDYRFHRWSDSDG